MFSNLDLARLKTILSARNRLMGATTRFYVRGNPILVCPSSMQNELVGTYYSLSTTSTQSAIPVPLDLLKRPNDIAPELGVGFALDKVG
jgi:hypothetical protein